MWGKVGRDSKTRWYPAIGALMAIGLIAGGAWVLGSFLSQSPRETSRFNRLPASENILSDSVQPPPTAVPQPSAPPAQPQANAPKPKPNPATVAARQGGLRVSNPTDYPVRIALLTKFAALRKNPAISNASGRYDLPAHWDFDPQEGSTKGLIVSLPDRGIQIKPGDILVAFALDGSRRYWGPYVVGDTEFPTWNSKTVEWELTLTP